MPHRLKHLAKCCEIKGEGDIEILGITQDSRKVRPGWLFAALPGTQTDGARFIPEAVERGAVALLAGRDVPLPDLPRPVTIVRSDNPARALALIAARFFLHQPVTIVAVTGTNGKSSVVDFVRQIWRFMGFRAASMGTLGVHGVDVEDLDVGHTTPDPVTLHEVLAKMRKRAISHLAMEASSHGLVQHRLDGVRLTAGGFTSFSRDHLDYHRDMDAYFEAKMRLFEALLHPPAGAVINVDDEAGAEVARRARERGLLVLDVGLVGHGIEMVERRIEGFGQQLRLRTRKREYKIYLPLVGRFQAENALVAAGLVIAAGGPEEEAILGLERLRSVRGRMELVARTASGAAVFVDYAHTPDALKAALEALRPYVGTGARLIVVFGAGGDRDAGKRPQMGEVAAQLADVVIVTDDNPRHEDPARIRRAILAACPGAMEIADRAAAIRQGMALLKEGDILLVAGKGHETGQIVGNAVHPFSDHEEILRWIEEEQDR